jgi:citronellol/citronellal dehydrogenase
VTVLAPDANAGLVALVTGGGTGIGRATALEFARTGARVAICGRRPEPLEETRASVEADGGECLAVPTDIREAAVLEALVERTLERFGAVDVLVNNAGGQFVAPAEEITAKGWRAVPPPRGRRRVEPHEPRGVSLDAPQRARARRLHRLQPAAGNPGDGPCLGSSSGSRGSRKRALERVEPARRARRLCRPGAILTEGLEGYGAERIAEWEQAVPLGRLGRPEEVAAVIAFLASAGGAYVSGTTVVVDDGVDAWGLAEPPPRPAGS